MYALYDVGRMTERLYGSRAFLALYVLSGLLGSAASVWWNPLVNSVGASGALFGVLGACFVYMADKRNGVPMAVMSTHIASLGVFIAYGIVNGLSRSNIDNAATENGKPYSELPNAFRYRNEIVAGCTCNGKDAMGLARVAIEDDPTLRKGDIVAGENGLVVANNSADRRGAPVAFSPASERIKARFRPPPVVAKGSR